MTSGKTGKIIGTFPCFLQNRFWYFDFHFIATLFARPINALVSCTRKSKSKSIISQPSLPSLFKYSSASSNVTFDCLNMPFSTPASFLESINSYKTSNNVYSLNFLSTKCFIYMYLFLFSIKL